MQTGQPWPAVIGAHTHALADMNEEDFERGTKMIGVDLACIEQKKKW